MKIRTDFVSNSSSSSFVLWGVDFDVDELTQKLKDAGFLKDKEDCEDGEDGYGYSNEALCEFLDEKFDYDEYVIGDDAVVLGMKPDKMKDEETLAQFKQRVVDKLKAAGIPVDGLGKVTLVTGVDADGDIMFD